MNLFKISIEFYIISVFCRKYKKGIMIEIKHSSGGGNSYIKESKMRR